MLLTLVFINTIIFIVLSGIHFYWLAGGKLGLAVSLPYNPSTQDFLFKPSILATLVVAFCLLIFAFVTFGNTGMFPFEMDQRYFKWGDLVISLIFLVRVVGDFKYVGFFKRIHETPFALMDTRYYSPICLLVSVVAILIYYLD